MGMSKLPALAILMAMTARAVAAGDLDGTWAGGWDSGDGVQIIVVGDTIIGFYRDGQDYVDIEHSSAVPGAIDFAWKNGEAVLSRDAKTGVRLVLHDKGKPAKTIPLKRD